tara:strand:+ start:790 stop:1005 length:216 start_codon:yes stop_codon:yes gene_type:complete
MNFSKSFNSALNRPILNADKPYIIIDKLNNNKVIKQYKSFKLAHKRKNEFDLEYGGYRYLVKNVRTIQDYS